MQYDLKIQQHSNLKMCLPQKAFLCGYVVSAFCSKDIVFQAVHGLVC